MAARDIMNDVISIHRQQGCIAKEKREIVLLSVKINVLK